jgi:Uma2 family endonuclease
MSLTPVAPKLVLGPRLAGTLMTPEEFDAVEEYDEAYRYELIHGVLVVTPIPLGEEADPNEELGHWLLTYRDQHPQGAALDATLPQQYVYTPTHRRMADRLIRAGLGRMPNRRRDLATIAVEFVSASRRDRRRDYEEKRREYMELGIPEYWIIDRFRRTMTVWISDPAGPREQVTQAGQVYRTPRLPGFELAVDRLFAQADAWGQP